MLTKIVLIIRKVCGLDVHRESVFMCILKENGDKIEEKFGVLTPELDRLRDLLVYHSVSKIAMESTSIYWVSIWRVLYSDFLVKLVNPYSIKQLSGRKNDVKDTQWIATVLQKEPIKGRFIPSGKSSPTCPPSSNSKCPPLSNLNGSSLI